MGRAGGLKSGASRVGGRNPTTWTVTATSALSGSWDQELQQVWSPITHIRDTGALLPPLGQVGNHGSHGFQWKHEHKCKGIHCMSWLYAERFFFSCSKAANLLHPKLIHNTQQHFYSALYSSCLAPS